MSRTLFAALVALAAALPAAAADETYTLKLYKEKEGDVIKKTKVSKTDGTVVFAVGEMKGDEKQKGSENSVLTEEVLKWPADAKRATQLKRTYEKVDKTNDKGDEVKSYLVGKTVVITREKDKATYTVDGKAPTDDQAKELDAEFGEKSGDFNKHDMMPDKAVKVGDTWKLDMKKVMAAMGDMKGLNADPDKSEFTGKLVKAAKKDGALRGTLEFTLKFVLADFPLGPNMAVPTEPGSEMVIKATIECCLDGTQPGEKSDLNMKIVVKAKLPMDGKLELNTTVTGTETEEPVKKK
jgi:hypothetical protein